MMQVRVGEVDDWDVEAQLDTGMPDFTLAGTTIRPSLKLQDHVLVTRCDWLQIKQGEVALMTHSPDASFNKHYLTTSGIQQALEGTPQQAWAHT